MRVGNDFATLVDEIKGELENKNLYVSDPVVTDYIVTKVKKKKKDGIFEDLW